MHPPTRHQSVLFCLLITLCGVASGSLHFDSCKQVTVIADTHWAPYSFESERQVRGAAVDLVEKVFSELDLPVQIVSFQNSAQVRHALEAGEADVLLTVYDHPKAQEFLDILEPGYVEDPVAILVTLSTAKKIQNWKDLTGLRGMTTDHFKLPKSLATLQGRTLSLHPQGNLMDALQWLDQERIDYVIGSKRQLQFAKDQLSLSEDLQLLNQVEYGAKVHMGYSKVSACRHYKPYLEQRLVELGQDGSVRRGIESYMNDIDFETNRTFS